MHAYAKTSRHTHSRRRSSSRGRRTAPPAATSAGAARGHRMAAAALAPPSRWQLPTFGAALAFFHASEFALAAAFDRGNLSARCEPPLPRCAQCARAACVCRSPLCLSTCLAVCIITTSLLTPFLSVPTSPSVPGRHPAALLLSRPYAVAMACGLAEHWLGRQLAPALKARLADRLSLAGLALVVAGEALRKAAMVRESGRQRIDLRPVCLASFLAPVSPTPSPPLTFHPHLPGQHVRPTTHTTTLWRRDRSTQLTARGAFTHNIQTQRRPGHRLVTRGVYRVARHPGYLGWLLWAVGTQLLLANPLCAAAFAYVVRFLSEGGRDGWRAAAITPGPCTAGGRGSTLSNSPPSPPPNHHPTTTTTVVALLPRAHRV